MVSVIEFSDIEKLYILCDEVRWTLTSLMEILSLSTSRGLKRESLSLQEQKRSIDGMVVYSTLPPISDIIILCTCPKKRRSGVASILLQRMIETICAIKGMEKIMLEVSPMNAPALSFYMKWGFKVVSTRKGYYGPEEDALVMELLV